MSRWILKRYSCWQLIRAQRIKRRNIEIRSMQNNSWDWCNLSAKEVEQVRNYHQLREVLCGDTLLVYHNLRNKGYGHYELVV